MVAVNAVLALTLPSTIWATSHTLSGHSLNKVFRHRRQTVPTKLPGNWTSQGCVVDNPGSRTLLGAGYADSSKMTIETCIDFCDGKDYIYAGVEYSQECYCDNSIHGASNTTLSECNMPCSGNTLESCGAGGRLNLFWSGKQPPPPPVEVPSVGNWTSLGCYSEGTDGRALTTGMGVNGPMTIEGCTSACFAAGYPLAGTEYSAECYCGTKISNGGAPTDSKGCNMVCSGNNSEFCGGAGTLNLYNYTGTDLPPIGQQPPGGGGNPDVPVYPVTEGLPGNFSYVDCYIDNAHGRIFKHNEEPSDDLTVESCVTTCANLNYTIAGMEYSRECYCGNELINGAEIAPVGTCNMGCAGNATEACGGPARLSVYSSSKNITAYPVPTTVTTNLPGKYQYHGCVREEPGAARILPYQLIYKTNNTVENCLSQCAAFGYPVAAMEFEQECYCGDVEHVEAHGDALGEETECDTPCSGDPTQICGGAQRLSTYFWDGPIDVWHKPEVTGHYEFLVPGVVVPLIATVGINNKVTFVEKWGTSKFANSTGAYELDLSLVNDFHHAYREMHVKTDVFCGASIILPDKAGRQLNIGGWSLTSTYGVRLYTPSGSDGVNGTTDWEENPETLFLQRGRWYPTAVVMANSSILIVGGEVGSNGAAEPSLEILPTPPGGPTYLNMDWLQRTDPYNLYPFLHVLPGGDIFVGYYNEARIIDQVTMETVKELPNMPAAVNNFLGGRTYPLEGAAVMLPQHAPYTDPVTILVCGGSTPFADDAIDNCVSIAPQVENATWTLERMPSKRVMSCMVALPDGTFMIMNGAHHGEAGFGLASDPNLNAVLYDPTKPVHQRMSILNSTIVARMYHSEATLLPDGRVLISGSDPNPDGPEIYPEEMRIEAYIPPYLATGLKQPTFNVTENDWEYEGTYEITNIKLFQGDISGLRISLVAATSSTHGNTMGGRTIFPEFSCSGTSCSITAPPFDVVPPAWHMLFILDGPTPSHAQWVRIGGDPARLGEWPNMPGFAPPGI